MSITAQAVSYSIGKKRSELENEKQKIQKYLEKAPADKKDYH